MDYFEVCWSIFSTICLVNVFFGILVCEITTFTVLAAVPIFSSAAGAIANGLCYYVYYNDHPLVNEVVAAVFADFFWLVRLLQLTSLMRLLTHSIVTRRKSVALQLYHPRTSPPPDPMARLHYRLLDSDGSNRYLPSLHRRIPRQIPYRRRARVRSHHQLPTYWLFHIHGHFGMS
jgi:hypothetical protein